MQRHVQQREGACGPDFAESGLADAWQREIVPVPGGAVGTGAVGPLVGDCQLRSGSAIDVASHFGDFPRHQFGRRRRRWRRPFIDDVFRRHHPGPDTAKCRSMAGVRTVHAFQVLAAAVAVRQPRPERRLLAGVRMHPRRPRDEHCRDRLTQRQAGGDVTGRGPAREQAAALFTGLQRDLLHAVSSFISPALTPDTTASLTDRRAGRKRASTP